MSININKELIDVLTSGLSASEIKASIVNSDISYAILNERIKKNMTQKEFAEHLGVSQGMISKWESGDYNFTIETISNIFEKINLDFDFFITTDLKMFSVDEPIRFSEFNTDIQTLLIAG